MSKTLKLSALKNQYQFYCNEYAQKFANKQGIKLQYWVGDEVGGCAAFNSQHFFSMQEIVYDIDNKCEKGLILQWQEDSVDHHNMTQINYHSYATGLRYEHLKSIRKEAPMKK